MRALFVASDEASLKRNPLHGACSAAIMRYADQFGDYLSDSYIAAEKQAAMDDLAALAKIDRASAQRQ